MWSLLSVSSLLVLSVVSQNVVLVDITQGLVVGSRANGADYFEFHGIPYADSTSGSHRFKAPTPPPSFQTTFVANRRNIKCVHASGDSYEGTEDCLVANVFTPTINNTRRLPVMVWIKGKEFDNVHEHQLSFRNFVEQDVVVVSLNYRESILGFLCLGTETAPGNAGLKDIIAGLRWIQDNIAQFGGDPDNVSLFGHGSGAAAVDLVTLSPMANGLVHKAIAQSGTAVAPWAVTRDNVEYAVQVARALGHSGITDIDDLSTIFTRVSVAALMAVINELDLTDNSLAFAPCIEREGLEGVEPFLIKSPVQSITDGEYMQIPFMTGFVDIEGIIRAEEALEDNWLERMEESFPDFLQPDLHFSNEEEKARIAQEIKTFYFGNGPIMIDDYLKYHGDTMILVSAIREARMRATSGTASVYLYQFSYKGDLGDLFLVTPVFVERAAHSEELAYLFYDETRIERNRVIPPLDYAIGNMLIERWTNFAKTGIPSSESNTDWRPFTNDNQYFLRILDDEEIDEIVLDIECERPHPNYMSFWDPIYEEFFLDAEGRWNLNERNVTDDVNVVDEATEDDEDDVTEPGTPGNGEDEDCDEDGEEDCEDSASTAVSYTFLIVTLFAMLNKFHGSQILS